MADLDSPVAAHASRVAISNGGEMARIMEAADWSRSPIGAPAEWPQSLKTTIGLILPAAAQIVLFWGPEFVALYNDAYAPTIGDKHPRALGRPARENWAELWDDLEPLLQSVRDTGQTVSAKNRPFYIQRHGYPETVYFDISYSAVPDETGAVGGVLCIVSETTEQINAEERLRRVLETEAVGVIFFNYDGVVVDANQAFLTITGYDREQIARGELDWRRMTPAEWVPASEEQMEKLAATGRIGPYEKEYILADGSRRWMLFAGRDLGDGTIAEYCIDTTEAREAAQALSDSEERLRLAVENAEIGFWDVQEGHGDLTWPARTKAMFGISPNVPVTMDDFYAGLHPDDLPRVAEAYAAAADPARRALYDVEYRTIGKEDGKLRWVAAKGRGVFDREGPDARCVRVIGTAIDITSRKQTEEALGDESNNLEILNRTGAAIAGELDLERVVQLVTDAGVELTGAQFGAFFYNVINAEGESYTLYTLSGVDRSHFDKFPMPRNTQVFGPTFKGEGVVRSDDITKDPRYGKNAPYYGKPEGHLPVVSYLAVPVVSRTGDVIGGLFFGHERPAQFSNKHERLMLGIAAQAAVAIDNARLYGAAQHEIEQRVKAEQALTALNETLESRVAEEIKRRSQAEEVLRQAQKMETVGQLSGGIAHDFNNLLQIIHGNLSLIDKGMESTVANAKLRRSVANALAGTERAAALTKRLLAFSRRQPLEAKPIDVNRLITEMLEMLQRTLGETIVIRTDLSPDTPKALVDGNQLENAILNLAINARDAMPVGGRLNICTSVAEVDSPHSDEEETAPLRRLVRIEVRDTGHGMTEEVRSRAVEPFFSTKDVGQGTGLGLSMVYGFARQSGGHLVLNSREGAGTSIELYLPATDETAHEPEVRTSLDKLPVGRGERVLLCEDDDDVRFFSSETLKDLGYEVIEAKDAASALVELTRLGRIDLLFTDVVLPGGKTGADLAREARKVQPDLKVLFTTGYARSALDREQRSGEAVQILLKPFGVDQLASKVREMLSFRN
jgi:PAS domain S-box-containing protein